MQKKDYVMATFYHGIGGAFGGHVGPVVGYMWKQRACLRAYRQHINYPNTASQQQQRNWFVGMVRFASQAKEALRLGLAQKADEASMTEGNYFVMKNKQHFGRSGDGIGIDYARLSIAEGAAACVLFDKLRFETGEVVHVSYEKNTIFSRASNDDRVYIYLYSPDLQMGILSAPAARRDKFISIKLPEQWAGLQVHVYGFVVDRNGRPSDSAYVGTGRVDHNEDRGRYIPLDGKWMEFVSLVENDDTTTSNHYSEADAIVSVALPFPRQSANPPDK